jgi:hypothetical protein
MGSYQKSDIEHKNSEKKTEEKSVFSSFGTASTKEINKMTNEQKRKYIITGEK